MNELERIEMLANEKDITNHERIRDVLNKLLNLRYSELIGSAQCENDLILTDISEGFGLDVDRIKDCSVKEILGLISMEPDITDCDYFVPLKEANLSTLPETAFHSFLMCKAFTVFGRNNPRVKKFLKIDYNALVSLFEQSGDRKAVESLNYMHSLLISYAILPEHRNLLVGDVLSEIFRKGSLPWVCGLIPISDYSRDVHRSYTLANTMIMDVISNFTAADSAVPQPTIKKERDNNDFD